MKVTVSYSRHYGSFGKCSLTLTADSQTLKTSCETSNPIAYNLKIVEYHESDSTEGFTANLRFQVASIEIFEGHHKTFESENKLSGLYGL